MKKFLQKRLSVLLALLMVFSMFVFTPEMFTKAEAANTDAFGTHLVRVIFYVGGDEWECDKDKNLYLLYKESRNSTTIKSARLTTTSKNNFNTKNTWYWLGGSDPTYGWTAGHDEERPGIEINGFPVGIDFSAMKSNNSCEAANYSQGHIQVWNYNTNEWVNVEDGTNGFSDGGSSGYTFTRKEKLVTLTSDKSPKANAITWAGDNPGSSEIAVKPASDNSVTGTSAALVTDQYGASLTTSDIAFKIYDSETGSNQLNSAYATVAKSSDNKPVVTVKTAANEWILGGGSTQRSLYVQAYCNQTSPSASVSTGTDRFELSVSNYQVTVDYNLNGGTYWGNEDDHTATKNEKVDYGYSPAEIPQEAYKKGYIFDGVFTAASGGTQVTETTTVKASGTDPAKVTYYAHWTPKDCPVEFYNSDGQLISRVISKYDRTISSVPSPAAPTYPGKTEAVNAKYAFNEWIVWDAPGHDNWAGTSIDSRRADKLDCENEATPLKFIATYTFGGTVKTYKATFKMPNGSTITPEISGVYWTPITPYDATSKPALAQTTTNTNTMFRPNGFDVDNYDYTFEGWTTTVPENGKWTEVEAGEAEYTSSDIYRLKENVTFYPCYSKSIKQCQVTRRYYVFDENNFLTLKTERIKDSGTTLGSTYDLGAPDPFSFNQDGYTYTFKGWKATSSNIIYGAEGIDADVLYSGGKAEIALGGDVNYIAIYEKTEIKYNAYYYNGETLLDSFEDLSRYNNGTLVGYNTQTQYSGDTPEKDREGQIGFEFIGWVEDKTNTINPAASQLVTSYTFGDQSKSFYAAYRTYDFYTVTFKDDSGNVLQTSKDYIAGDVIAHTAEAPAEGADVKMFVPIVENKASGAQYQYTFMGWQSNNDAENTLTFEDEVLGEVKYAIGATGSVNVSGDRVYTAVFKKEIRVYKIYLYGIGANPDITTNDDGYDCYTNDGVNYFVKDKNIYTYVNDEYVLYAGELSISDLTPIKPPAKKVLELKYGENILDAVKALYGYVQENGVDKEHIDKNVTMIDGNQLSIVLTGDTEATDLPYEDYSHSYSFNGWTPTINPNATVTGDASYVATYRTDNVLYNVHWFVPTSCSAAAPYPATSSASYSETTTLYRYRRTIAAPAKTPTCPAPTTIANYTWTFLGWYECDENKVIKTDSEGHEIKYSKGTIVDPEANDGSYDFYYVAKFGFVANNYIINVYVENEENVNELVGTYKGAYGSPIYITNYTKASDDDYHYVIEGFEDIAGVAAFVEADTETDATEYLVEGNIDLKVRYRAEDHGWTFADRAVIQHTTPATYAADGEDTITCICGYKKTEVVPRLIDDNGPTGKIAIKSYNWDSTSGPDEAYIRSDSLIAIMAVDYGANDINDEPLYNEGNGIKSIVYTWSNGATGGRFDYDEYESTSVNADIQLPTGDDFTEGMKLRVVIADHTNRTYTIETGRLYTDTVRPEVKYVSTCEGFDFAIFEDHFDKATLMHGETEIALDTIVLSDAKKLELRDKVNPSEELMASYINAYGITKKADEDVGDYVLTVTDKAGNTTTVTFTITETGHEWNKGKETQALTCTNDGITLFTCTKCGDTKEEKVLAEGHSWNAEYEGEGDEAVFVKYIYTIDKEATCTEEGLQSIHCSVCGEVKEDSEDTIAMKPHELETNEKEATCAAAGYKVVTCKNCSLYEHTDYEQLTHEIDLTVEGADKEGWVIGKEATCTAEGNKYQVCALCSEKINKTVILKTAHDYEDITPEKNYCQTEVVAGATAATYHIYKCKDCGYSYEFNKTAENHKYDIKVVTDATCTENEIDHITCSVCGDHYDEEIRLTSLGHDWEEDFTIDTQATCLNAGSKSIHCTRCSEKKDVTVIPATGHDYNVVTIEATAHTAGSNTYTCKNCAEGTEGHSYTETIEPTGEHDFVATNDKKEATCTEDGYIVYECSYEGCEVTYKETIPMKGHTAGTTVLSHEDATCRAYETTVYKCKDCEEGTVTVYGDEYAAHKKGDLVKTLTEATCTTDGEGIYNCSVCGETMQVTIPATGEHDYVDTVKVAATCTENGIMKHTCSVCGDEKETPIIAPGLHDWNAVYEGEGDEAVFVEYVYTVDTEATCTAKGAKSIHCSRCDAIKEGSGAEIDKLGHDKIIDAAVAATCSKAGKTEGWHCSRCDEKKEQTATDKLPHTQGDLMTVNTVPTCVSKGESVYRCSECGESYIVITDEDPTAHNWGGWSAWTEEEAATCLTAGSEKRTRTCQNEGCTADADVETREIEALGHDMVIDPARPATTVTEAGVTTVTTYYKCQREGCDYTEEKPEVTTLYKVTVDGVVIELIGGEPLTEAKIVEALGAVPTKATTADEDGAYIINWKVGEDTVTLPLDVTGDITLTYEFTFVANKYTVTFYNYGGKVISSAEYTKGQEVVVPEYNLAGYRVLGWNDGTTNYASDEIPVVTASVSYTPWVVAESSIKRYYVNFKNESGTTTYKEVVKEYAEGETVTIEDPGLTPKKASNPAIHYVFVGWVDKDGNDITFPVTINSSMDFYEKFETESHDYKVIKRVAPTCTTAEEITYKCSVCDRIKEEKKDVTGHTNIEVSREVEGNTTVVNYVCSVCGAATQKTFTTGTQTEIIVVKVTDGSAPVEGALVTVYIGSARTLVATTDESGCAYFGKDQLPDGSYQTKVTKDGYDSVAGTMVVTNGTAMLKIKLTKPVCHCVCHANSFFGKVRRMFNKFFRLFNKNYTCCSCGECEKIY